MRRKAQYDGPAFKTEDIDFAEDRDYMMMENIYYASLATGAVGQPTDFP